MTVVFSFQSSEKASKIVEEFFKHEENENLIEKRKDLFRLQSKLKFYKDLIEQHGKHGDQSDDELV